MDWSAASDERAKLGDLLSVKKGLVEEGKGAGERKARERTRVSASGNRDRLEDGMGAVLPRI